MLDCPGEVTVIEESGTGWIVVCDQPWTITDHWWSLSIEDAGTLAMAILTLWAIAWVYRQLTRVG